MHETIHSSFLHLASGSVVRQELLRSSGLDITARAVSLDEEKIKQDAHIRALGFPEMAIELARRKAAAAEPTARFVLGCDQLLDVEGRLISKVETREAAAEVLQSLQGRTHRLLSAAVVFTAGSEVWSAVTEAKLSMHPLSAEDIDGYLAATWPEVGNSVGCYHLEGRGVRLFSRIEGDYFTILGLPLLELLSFLRAEGGLRP
ncbi:MAG: Maf family protein [Pseudomonadota bacterium]